MNSEIGFASSADPSVGNSVVEEYTNITRFTTKATKQLINNKTSDFFYSKTYKIILGDDLFLNNIFLKSTVSL